MAQEEQVNTPLGVKDQIREGFVTDRAQRIRYEDTESFAKDEETESLRQQVTAIKEEETVAIANDQKGFIGESVEFAKNLALGPVVAVGEVIQAVGGPDNVFGIEPAEDVADQIARGLGQAFIPFGVATKGITVGFKLAKIFQNSKGLTRAGATISNVAAGALTEAFAFDPRDPNSADLALAIGIISKDSRLGAATKEFLAQKDSDPEAVARFKAALSGLMAGALIDSLIKGAGLVHRSVKGVKKADASPEGLEEAVKEFSDGSVEALDRIRLEVDDKQLKEATSKLPDPETAEAAAKQKFKDDPIKNIEENSKSKRDQGDQGSGGSGSSAGTGGRMPPEIEEMFNKLGNGETIPDQGLDEILAFNLLKSDAPEDIANVIQFVARHMNIKEIVKPSIATADIDVVIGDMVDSFMDVDAEGKGAILDLLKQQVDNINDAIPYIGTVKALTTLNTREIARLSTQFAKNPTTANYDLKMKAWQVEKSLLFNGAGLSKATSDALRAHAKKLDLSSSNPLTKKELQKRTIDPDIEIQVLSSTHASKLDRMDKLGIDEAKLQTKGVERDFDIEVPEGTITVKGSVRQAKDKSSRKRTFTIDKLKETPTGKRIAAAITKLENIKASLLRPERGAPFPKDKPIKDVANPEQIAKINSIKADIKRIKGERDTLFNKFKKQAKPQLKLRKKFEKLSKEIEKLQKGINPKATLKEREIVTSPDIATLQAERDKLVKELEPLDATDAKLQKLNDKFSDLLTARLENDFGTITKAERTVINEDLERAIFREQERARTAISNAEIKEAFTLKAQAAELADIDKMSFNQMKTRLAAMDRGLAAKSTKVLSEIYVNGLLSSFKGIGEVNPMGTASAIVSSIFERSFAALKTTVTGKGDIDFKEVSILGWNYLAGIPDAFRLAGKALRHGTDDPNFKSDLVNVRDRGISKEAFNLGGNLGKAVDYLGTAVNMPGKLILSTDVGFKALITRSEQRALAYRKARNEVGDASTEVELSAIGKRTQDILDNILKHEDIVAQARDSADKLTFTNKLPDRIVTDAFGKERKVDGVAKSINNFIVQGDPTGISRIFIPFFQTPANIFNFTFERTPIINRFSNSLKQELKSTVPGVKELAEARMATAYVIWGGLMTTSYMGNFAGAPPRDHNLRKTIEASTGTRHWHGVNLGGGWRTFDRFDPFGLILGAAAVGGNMMKGMTNLAGQYERGDHSDAIAEKFNEVMMAGVVGMAELVKDKTYLAAIGELIDVFNTDGRGMHRTEKRLLSFVNPQLSLYSSLRRDVTRGLTRGVKPERLQEKESEEDGLFNKTLNAISNEIANVFEQANDDVNFGWGNRFAMKDLAGNVAQYPGTNQALDVTNNLVVTMLNPAPAGTPSKSPLINTLARLESKIGQPSALDKVGGVTLTDEEKSFIIDFWTDSNKSLDKYVLTKGFLDMPEGVQLYQIEEEIKENKRVAIEAGKLKFSRLGERAEEVSKNRIENILQETRSTGFQPPQ